MRKGIKYVLLLAVLFAVSCTREELDDCISGVRLHFRFTLHEQPERGNLFGENVGNVQVYVFDGNGILQHIQAESGAVLTNDYVMTLPLAPGRYTIVAWASDNQNIFNTHNMFEIMPLAAVTPSGAELVIGKSRFEELRAGLDCEALVGYPEAIRPKTDNFDDFYYGAVGTRSSDGSDEYAIIPVEVKQAENTDCEVELIRNTNIVRITIEGAETLTGGNPIGNPEDIVDIWMTGYNTRYHFDDAVSIGTEQVRYFPQYKLVNSGTIQADVKTERLEWARSGDGQIKLYAKLRSGKVMYAGDLLDILKQAKDGRGRNIYKNQEDLDRIYIHPVRFVIGGTVSDLYISIYVHNWEVIILDPGVI